MLANRAVLLARPDRQSSLAFGAGDLNELDALFLGYLLKNKRSRRSLTTEFWLLPEALPEPYNTDETTPKQEQRDGSDDEVFRELAE
jgi:hypothetical protein